MSRNLWFVHMCYVFVIWVSLEKAPGQICSSVPHCTPSRLSFSVSHLQRTTPATRPTYKQFGSRLTSERINSSHNHWAYVRMLITDSQQLDWLIHTREQNEIWHWGRVQSETIDLLVVCDLIISSCVFFYASAHFKSHIKSPAYSKQNKQWTMYANQTSVSL